ncbi:MAG: DEAD/DEAH box helicase family protein [Candidatus Promineofilum sp.]|nr:DEAD/DEAH box helicase family protein [Promineifilum sp.]MBP9657991.1 DEAD/DEAH box helicase family protein [Promineifilum sp.]
MSNKEAKARIKINKLLEAAGWRFFDDENGPANIQLEAYTRITRQKLDEMGENFEKTEKGFLDFLLLDERGVPLAVLEAKHEGLHPLGAKEQARRYAKSQNCRFVILSNGNLHYFWDLERGNPNPITDFPRPESIKQYGIWRPNPKALADEPVAGDYIALSQMPEYARMAGWRDEAERPRFIETNKLRFLRPYQLRAIQAIQREVRDGHDRFLFEMATGTGKTLTAAAVIKLFLRTGNACRVLFLVDRLELEDQAWRAFVALLKNDYKAVIYKENRDDWRRAEIVVTTVQSLLFDNKYKRLFSPTDFDLVISDEAHRSIGGNARAVFEHFVGYKLGLTATPRDYLKKIESNNSAYDPREHERRVLLDTYRTFGCESGTPTFRYSLIDGVRDGYLINPIVVDARSEVTTQLLSDEGYAVVVENEDGEEAEESYRGRDFEKRFFSETTNRLFCRTFLENALLDPISGEIGKSIVFAVSQNHAAKLVQILNEMADRLFPGKYNSDFAVQVTSQVADAQQMAINFANNNLLGSANFLPGYKTSKARVCVTVGMMTTGYDCPDILNLALMRPIFSPTDFIQIKGRGTRKHDFFQELHDAHLKADLPPAVKVSYKLFDFFANCEYFEEEYNYDQVLKLPRPAAPQPGDETGGGRGPVVYDGEYENFDPDRLLDFREQRVGLEGMKIDRMYFQKFEERVTDDQALRELVLNEQWDRVEEYVRAHIMDRPEEFFTLEKLRRSTGIDRRVSLREMVEKALGRIPRFKSKDELLDEEFARFMAEEAPGEYSEVAVAAIPEARNFFKAYLSDGRLRDIIDKGTFSDLNTNPGFTMRDYKTVPAKWRTRIPEYIKDYVPLNKFI